MIGVDPEIDRVHVPQAHDEQARADEQERRQRDLAADQHLLKA
jgi:hypothetical protein